MTPAVAAELVRALRTVAAETQADANTACAASYKAWYQSGQAAGLAAAAQIVEAAAQIDEREFKAGLSESETND